jgi:hypothetical protein
MTELNDNLLVIDEGQNEVMEDIFCCLTAMAYF